MKAKLLRKLRKKFVILPDLFARDKFVVVMNTSGFTCKELTKAISESSAKTCRRIFILYHMRKHYFHFDK